MNTKLETDLTNLEVIFDKVKGQGLHYLNHLESRPTSALVLATTKENLLTNGLGSLATLATLDEFNNRLEPLMVASSGPSYWGFVTGGSTPAAIVGDWLATLYDQNTQAEKGNGDNSAKIELEGIQLLMNILNLPKDYLGGFVTGATLAR